MISAAASLGAGCGGSSDGISVQTGTLTKAEFVKRANAVCSVVRTQFVRDFADYYRDHTPKKVGSEKAWEEAVIEKAVVPNYGGLMIDQLSAIGAPSSEKAKVVSFLETLQQRVHELQEDPDELTKSPYPFAKPATLAKKYGLIKCARAFS
jgi:hypothetical protein